MAGFFRTDRNYFTHEMMGQQTHVHFTDAAIEAGAPADLVVTYMGGRLLDRDAATPDAQRAATEVYLIPANSEIEMRVRLSEIKAVWPPRNDKRDATRATARTMPDGTPRVRGKSIPLDLSTAIEIDAII